MKNFFQYFVRNKLFGSSEKKFYLSEQNLIICKSINILHHSPTIILCIAGFILGDFLVRFGINHYNYIFIVLYQNEITPMLFVTPKLIIYIVDC